MHAVLVDVGCRNTVFNAQAQTAASLVPEPARAASRASALELVRESAAEAAALLAAYAELVAGALAARRGRAARGRRTSSSA